ncbi:uncharacterized protein LOC128176948 [Crassostrea angulata]|uniref:uncharacterized protein LOC128176948 n=1 Tax=Magallana angulata TaxID=2784310 RepID=UPI0022B128CC|nr:uncharacterized protein LOC128176948 [Crassostrea angulata]
MVNLKVLLSLIAVIGVFKLIAGSSVIWYHYQTSQPKGQDYKVFHYFDFEDGMVVSSYEARYDGTECYTITNFTLRVVDGEPDFTLDKSLGDCKLYRVVRLHNETAIEPYRIVKVIVSNNFNRNTEECVSTSGSYHVVLTKTRTPSKQEKRKISHDLKTLGISGLYLTNLSVCPDPV